MASCDRYIAFSLTLDGSAKSLDGKKRTNFPQAKSETEGIGFWIYPVGAAIAALFFIFIGSCYIYKRRRTGRNELFTRKMQSAYSSDTAKAPSGEIPAAQFLGTSHFNHTMATTESSTDTEGNMHFHYYFVVDGLVQQ